MIFERIDFSFLHKEIAFIDSIKLSFFPGILQDRFTFMPTCMVFLSLFWIKKISFTVLLASQTTAMKRLRTE